MLASFLNEQDAQVSNTLKVTNQNHIDKLGVNKLSCGSSLKVCIGQTIFEKTY